MRTDAWLRIGTVLALVLLLAGCAARRAYRQAEVEARREHWDRAVLGYSKALALDPGNARYSVALERAKLKASAQHFEKGKRYAAAAQWELAVAELQQTLLLNPGNQHAATELDRALRELRRATEAPSDLERLKAEAQRRALEPPKLDPKSNIPIVMMFKKTPLGEILEALSKASGINFLYDDKVDLKAEVTIDLGSVTFRKALDILMLQTKNFYKIVDEHTILIAQDTRQKRQELEDQVIRTFYLSNGDTKQVVTLVRTLLNSRQVAENTALNSVTIKDTPDKVAIAEKIIEANDKAKGEVVVDVELLEINRTVAETLGIDLSSKTLSLTFRDGQQAVPLNNLRILRQQGNWLVGIIPSVILNFLKSDSESRTIAKPSVRVTEGEQAEILIGDRVPIPTTSFNTSQTIGGNIVPITSFTYQNVGITVQIEPRVHHNKEVTLKVQVEVSQISSFVEATGGNRQPIIGTRTIQTVIRLRDGETNLLAGLIRQEDSDNVSGVPGLSDIPGLHRLFGSNNRRTTQTDIILTLTPHIIRIPDITEEDLATLWVGTEENMRLRLPAQTTLQESPFGTGVEALPEGLAGESPAGVAAGTPEDTEPAARQPAPEQGMEEAQPRREPRVVGEEEEDEGQSAAEEEKAPAAEPTLAFVRLVPSQSVYRVGDPVVVQVVVEGAQNVGSAPFHLRYNRAVLEYLPDAAVEGPFLSSDGASTIFMATPASGGGELVVGLSRLGAAEGVSGSGVLATFTFQAVNPGDCEFAFVGASLKDPRARNLPAQFVSAPVRVEP